MANKSVVQPAKRAGSDEKVEDQRALAIWLLKKYHLVLLREHREDTLQELELFLWGKPPRTMRAFKNAFSRHFYRVRKNLGYYRPKNSPTFVRNFLALPWELGEETEVSYAWAI